MKRRSQGNGPLLYTEVVSGLQEFLPLLHRAINLSDDVSHQDASDLDEALKAADPSLVNAPLSRWLKVQDHAKLADLRFFRRGIGWGLRHLDSERVRTDAQGYLEVLQGLMAEVGPASFTYEGFFILNPDRLLNRRVRGLLDAVDYLNALFRRKGVEPLLRETVSRIELRIMEGTAHGLYSAQERRVTLRAGIEDRSFARLTETWVHEVLLHEIGHHVHLDFLHPRGREEWDSGWDEAHRARESLNNKLHVTPSDRQKFWELIERAGWDPKKAGRKVKGLMRAKYLAWLYYTEGNRLISTPNQVRLTPYGRGVMDFFRDPEKYRQEFLNAGLSPERSEKAFLRKVQAYMSNLAMTPWYANRLWPMLPQDKVDEIRSGDRSVSEALDRLGIPSSYGRTNPKEDFAETFVLFMTEPHRLSETARFRMKRALALSSLYGKPLMPLASKVAEAWLQRDPTFGVSRETGER